MMVIMVIAPSRIIAMVMITSIVTTIITGSNRRVYVGTVLPGSGHHW